MEEVTQLKPERNLGAGGIRLGVLDNSKGNADHLLNLIVEGVRKEFQVDTVIVRRKPTSSRPATDQVLDELAKEARSRHQRDGRLRVVHVVECPRHGAADEARADRRGGVLGLVHEARHGAGEVFGVPDLPLCTIQHPLGGARWKSARARRRRVAAILKVVKEKQS
jgi:hypothetical protein